MSDQCFLFDGCQSRTAACRASQPTDDGCPVYRWFRSIILPAPVSPKKVNRYMDIDENGEWYTPETYDCGNCGKELPDKADYCPCCGREVFRNDACKSG